MLPQPRNYAVQPSVIPADAVSEMTIVPLERAFLLWEDEEYTITVISVNSDEENYYDPARTVIKAKAHGGVLRFEFCFLGEQEHLIILEQGEKKLQEFTVFSLYEDLYKLTPLKGDLHSHSYRSDGQRDPAALAGHYREQGYDFQALTDHNRFYPGGEVDETYEGVRMGLVRVRGEEVHAPGSVVHIVHVGGKSSVAAQYVEDPEKFRLEAAEYEKKVPADIPDRYRERYAKAMWATDRIHEAGGLAIFAHPYWRPGKSRMYNVCDDLAKILLTSGMFDAYELMGGMRLNGNNRSVALWADLRAEGLKIPVVGSSDVHGIEKAWTFPYLFTICFAEGSDNDSIIEAVRAGRCVAVEAVGTEYERQYRCYGSLRMVTYAQYLLEHYFTERQRICQGEGAAMRAYAMGDAPKELIGLQADLAERFRQRFFGRKEPLTPSEEIMRFEDKWRRIQLNGPETKGGSIQAPPVTRQI
ncbi:MAG: CehA/McbA family metallohydrolase [Clostridia bacterium]|nr:CehA/McbA family metallohydrolase [Clostridia bacterium]